MVGCQSFSNEFNLSGTGGGTGVWRVRCLSPRLWLLLSVVGAPIQVTAMIPSDNYYGFIDDHALPVTWVALSCIGVVSILVWYKACSTRVDSIGIKAAVRSSETHFLFCAFLCHPPTTRLRTHLRF